MSSRTATPETTVARLAAVALNRAADGAAPEWVQILPRGDRLEGRDGRAWLNDLPAVLAAFQRHGAPIAIDFEHAQDIRARNGEEAPAACWIEEMQDRGGELWGRADWTPRGRRAVASREYRFLSPAFSFDPATTRIQAIVGGGLVNRPNFVMAALNRLSPQQDTPSMKTIATALGLAETATEAECVMALAAARAEHQTALARAGQPDLSKFVPRADLDTALNRASTAETKLREIEAAGQGKAAEAAVDKAIADGKVAPASKDFYLATCRDAAGLAAFNTHVAGLPSLFAGSGLDGKDPAAEAARAAAAQGRSVALNAEQKATARAMGIDETKFATFLTEQAAKRGDA